MTPVSPFLLVDFPKDSVLIPLLATHQDSADDESMGLCKLEKTWQKSGKKAGGGAERLYGEN